MTRVPLGRTLTTWPPTVVFRVELVTLCPCAVNALAEFWDTRFCKLLLAESFANNEATCEFALELLEFLTEPSVEAESASTTTMEIRSWVCIALTSDARRVKAPSSLQIEPIGCGSLSLCSRTRAM